MGESRLEEAWPLCLGVCRADPKEEAAAKPEPVSSKYLAQPKKATMNPSDT